MKRNSELSIRPVENGFVIFVYRAHCDSIERLAFESKKSLLAYLDMHFGSTKKAQDTLEEEKAK
jgi:hypothetical protein